MSDVTTSPALSAPPHSSGLSFRGLYEVFYRPAAFFAELKDRPKVLVPYLVLLILITTSMLLLAEMIVNAQLADPAIQERLSQQGITLSDSMRGMMRIQTIIMGTISMALVPVLAATLALLFGNFVFGGTASYKQLLSIALYAEILYHVGTLVSAPLMLMKGAFVSPFSLSVLVADRGLSDPLFILFSRIEVFLIWEIIVAGIGFSILYAVARSRGIVISLLSIGMLSALFVLWSVLASAIF